MLHGLGYKPSNHDPRDLSFGALMRAAPVPSRSDGVREFVGELQDQEDAEGCVGWSGAGCLNTRWNYLAAAQNVAPLVDRPSAMLWWWLARQTEGNATQNVGVYLRDAIKQVAKVGICSESHCVSNPPSEIVDGVPRYARSPTVDAFQHANDQKVGDKFQMGYYRVGQILTERKGQFSQAMAGGFPVQIGTLVSADFLNLGPHDPLPVPDITGQMAGGHALQCTHFDERGVYGPNTWQDKAKGILWGNDGWFALSWEYVLWNYTQDCWAFDAALPKGWS